MITNIVAYLHTTAAYQTAALQLMVGQANFAAKQLDLKEPLPITIPADTNKWEVEPPPMGIGGSLYCSNYSFDFGNGRLRSIRKLDWLKKTSPQTPNVLALAGLPSLLDTNSAYQLATRWLASLGVDVTELAKTSPPVIFQAMGRRRDAEGKPLPGDTNIWSAPLFMIGWGEDPVSPILREQLRKSNRPMRLRPPSPMSPVYVQILGTTKELIQLDVRDGSLFKSAALLLTNAGELLGPIPPPQHFVEELVGGKEAYQTVAAPDKVEAWLLNSSFGGDEVVEKTNRTAAVKLKPTTAKKISDILTDFNSYAWGEMKMCIADYGVRLKFTRGDDTVEFRLCYECDLLGVSHNGKVLTQDTSFDPSHSTLANAIQTVFPDDEAIKNLKTHEN